MQKYNRKYFNINYYAQNPTHTHRLFAKSEFVNIFIAIHARKQIIRLTNVCMKEYNYRLKNEKKICFMINQHFGKLLIRSVIIAVTSGSRSVHLAEPIVFTRSNQTECETLYLCMHAAIKLDCTRIFSQTRFERFDTPND